MDEPSQSIPESAWISHFPELGTVAEPEWSSLVQHTRTQSLSRGTVLFSPGFPCRNVILLLSGTVRIVMHGETGREILLHRVTAADLIIITIPELFSELSDLAEGIAESDVRVGLVPFQPFADAIGACPAFRHFVFSRIASRLGSVMSLLDRIAFLRLDVRLAELLLRAVDQTGNRTLRTTHHDLAVELWSSRESVSRLLKDFERNGWVRLDRGRVEIVAMDELSRIARIG